MTSAQRGHINAVTCTCTGWLLIGLGTTTVVRAAGLGMALSGLLFMWANERRIRAAGTERMTP